MSVKPILCNTLIIEQKPNNGFLAGPYKVQLDISEQYSMCIMQGGNRVLEFAFDRGVPIQEMLDEFQSIEKLLMMFDGRFYPIENIMCQNCSEEVDHYSNLFLENRLGYYSSKDFCQYHFMKLLDFHEVLTSTMYSKWKDILEQLDIAYQVFLYTLSDNGNPVDMNLAFLVELAEPFVELVKENSFYCQTLSPGERGTTLKQCINSLVTLYGTDIFTAELRNDYSGFLSTAVGIRVRIMHIKKKQQKYWNGVDSVRYSMKFSLLYRRILMDLIGIPYDIYRDRLRIAAKRIDIWNP